MELETLLTGSKWEIIELLAKESLSPIEIAKRLKTTIANVSMQLRLLQTAGLVKKEKTGSAGAGKPRTLFSLSDNYGFIIVFSKKFAKKKLLKLKKEQTEQLKRWLRED
ncbi:winged helix-turn-helix domain-containing protein [Candidatus Woesearchaeota archaeon]|nr:winged helix-turn-helix domain-containing protein [Candidatus Woesearchaeota archaeon]